MTRRQLILAGLAVTAGWPLHTALAHQLGRGSRPVDPGFVRDWDAAGASRPAVMPGIAVIAPPGEAGRRLLVRGQVFEADGRTPLRQVVVFAHHTDDRGDYNVKGQRGWRLKGWARTDDDGRFGFDTIRPAPYPGRDTAAHIHLGIDGARGARQLLDDVLFEGDPLLTAEQTRKAAAAGPFGNIARVVRREGRDECDVRFRLTGEFVF